MWIWRRMENISWLETVTNEEVITRYTKTGKCWNSIWQMKQWWIGHVLGHDGVLHEVIEGRMEEKNSNATQFGRWWWLCCTQMGSWGQRGMETQRKGVENLLYSRKLLMTTSVLSWTLLIRVVFILQCFHTVSWVMGRTSSPVMFYLSKTKVEWFHLLILKVKLKWFLGRLPKVDLIILERGKNVRPYVRTSVRPSVHKKFLRFEWNSVCR